MDSRANRRNQLLRFRAGLVWLVGLTGEIKQCFHDGLVWTVGLTGSRNKAAFSNSSGVVWIGP